MSSRNKFLSFCLLSNIFKENPHFSVYFSYASKKEISGKKYQFDINNLSLQTSFHPHFLATKKMNLFFSSLFTLDTIQDFYKLFDVSDLPKGYWTKVNKMEIYNHYSFRSLLMVGITIQKVVSSTKTYICYERKILLVLFCEPFNKYIRNKFFIRFNF